MKTKQIYLGILSLFIISHLFAQKELPAGIDKDWYAAQTATLQKMQYAFKPSTVNSWQAANKNLLITINEHGYALKPAGNAWSAEFVINTNAAASLTDAGLTFTGKEFSTEYINDNSGLRQNFILHKKTDIRFKIQTGLRISKSHNGIALSDGGKIIALYDGLKVWDAARKPLNATMSLNNNEVTIHVDDKDAVYPVTIDPLNHLPEWETSADGVLPGLLTNVQLQAQTNYGFTVAGLGDINGDSYDDVAIGAPTMADVWSGNGTLTAAGAVFVYLGSINGLHTAPDKILQPTTAIDGALFGFSIDAGDITGDGKNDIVIGAPLDSYQTSAVGSIFQVTVKAGKVYVYNSEALFSAPNPTPFLQLHLEGSNYFSILNLNVTLNALFGYSVAVTKSLNSADTKADIIIGCPAFVGADLLSVQNGAAFIYYSNDLATATPAMLNPPDLSLLGIPGLPLLNTKGLLFGFSVDGAGDYDNNGKPDVVVGAPAGVDLSSLAGIFSGQFLGGSAYVFYNNGTNINTAATVKLQANVSGLLGNAANLFGYKVKGAKDAFGNKTGNILIGAPNGGLTNTILSLTVKSGQLHVFKRKTPLVAGTFASDQTITTPRYSSVLSILGGRTINVGLLYAAAIDNMLDVNCDNIGDIIVGEPLSTAVPFLGADVVGGAAYVYLGNADGTYQTSPYHTLTTDIAPLLGVNATAMMGYSVAGAGHTKGGGGGVRSLVGGPTNALDFGSGLLNLNNTIGTTFSFVADANGLGKAYSYGFTNCNVTLPVSLFDFRGSAVGATVPLSWDAVAEINFNNYELQRSTDGIRYDNIAVVFGKSQQRSSYGFTDTHPYRGMNYYRLKMVDRDGAFTYSGIVAVKFDGAINADLVVAPNPVQSQINIRVSGIEKGIYKIALMNAVGQTLQQKTISITNFYEPVTMERNSSMQAGIYWLALYDTAGRKIKSVPLLVQ